MTRAGLFLVSIITYTALATSSLRAAEIAGTVRITKRLTHQKVALGATLYARGIAVPVEKTEESGFEASELARTVVYLEGQGLPAPLPQRATLEQRGRRFEPEIVSVPAGSTVSFPNGDPIFHNVFSLAKAKSFDLGNYAKNQTRTVTFDKPGIVPVYCHLHPNMSAAIVVTPSSYAVRPGPDGRFALQDVPPGEYHVVVWHKSAGFFRGTADVRINGRVELNFVIPVRETVVGQP